MTLQRIKLPVFFYVFVPIQQVKVAKENMLSTFLKLPTKTRPPGPIFKLSHPSINYMSFIRNFTA